jgi:hypothetical protein
MYNQLKHISKKSYKQLNDDNLEIDKNLTFEKKEDNLFHIFIHHF